MCQVLIQVRNVLLVLERTTARLSHIKVVSSLPECEVKAVYVLGFNDSKTESVLDTSWFYGTPSIVGSNVVMW